MPEDRAVRILWRLLAPSTMLEDFAHHLEMGHRPEWNQAVWQIADAMRDYARQLGLEDREARLDEQAIRQEERQLCAAMRSKDFCEKCPNYESCPGVNLVPWDWGCPLQPGVMPR